MKQMQCNVLDQLKQAQIKQVWLYFRDSQNYTAGRDTRALDHESSD